MQTKFPKITRNNFSPTDFNDSRLNWNPPGHGEIYPALKISGVMDQLLEKGIEYVFISNADNLGAVVDGRILSYFADNKIPFLMEVCRRSETDKKGGHLAQTTDGRLILREIAQCPENEIEKFQNFRKYSYFNSNNLWVNLKSLRKKMAENDDVLPLAMIVNPKTVQGKEVLQLESAMGAAISVFEKSQAIIIERDRFTPVKKTNDLLAVWSDAYELTADFHLVLNENLRSAPVIDLDEKYFGTIELLKKHCRNGVPSLKKCKKLKISGELYFEESDIFEGELDITGSER